jgi:putative SOS response-associated peptidase YedK
MCGRFTLTEVDPGKLRLRFRVDESAEVDERPRFNIAPTDPVLAVRELAEGRREAGRLRWGLLPGRWAEDSGRPLINARAETLTEQPAFRDAFRVRRCLIPADGFYEWREDEHGKQPVWIHRADSELFAFAGIWAQLGDRNGDQLHSCAIVTCEPNEVVRPIHDRMPVILAPEAEAPWLAPGSSPDELLGLLTPLDAKALSVREVSDAVNDVRQNGPELLEPPLKLF